jgi:hypothetical protein
LIAFPKFHKQKLEFFICATTNLLKLQIFDKNALEKGLQEQDTRGLLYLLKVATFENKWHSTVNS